MDTTNSNPLRALASTTLRVGVGIVMVTHGWAKLSDMSSWHSQVESLGIPLPGIASWLAVAGELLGGAGLIVGFLTPVAAFGVLATMLTAIFTAHWGNGLLAQNNGFELPLTLALAAFYFMIRGAGPISVDAAVSAARSKLRREREKGAREGDKKRTEIEGRRMEPAEATSG